MDNSNNFEHFFKEPSLLIEACQEVIDYLAAGADDSEIGEKEAQLREISRTIDRLNKTGVAVPEVLRAEKTRLAAELGIKFEGLKALNYLADEFEELLKNLKALLHRGVNIREPGKPRQKRSHSPRTDRQVIREHIIQALKKLGGRASNADVLIEMGRQLSGKFLPGDLETLKDGKRIVWQYKTQWERFRMIQDGILSNNSPRGYWELSEGQE